MRKFVNRELSGDAFAREYIESYKNDTARWDDDEFDILDAVFGMADCFVPDPVLLAGLRIEVSNPNFYLDEEQLHQKVMSALKKLEKVT